jgi:MraZ protein
MFRGRHYHTIDGKGRLSVPAKFRDELNRRGAETLVLTEGGQPCLWAYPLDEWEKVEQDWNSRTELTPEQRALMRMVISSAKECPVDRAGRTLVPPDLRQFAHLAQDVVIVGMLRRFEIWSADRWAEHYGTLRGGFDERGLEEFGL